MANRYWVGGNGTWDASSTTNWSASSGGASGASAPTSVDAVIFDSSSGTGTANVQANAAASTIAFNTPNIIFNLQGNLSIASSFTLTSGSIVLNSYSMTIANFSSSNSNVRSINFGTGKIIATGSGFPWGAGTVTNMSILGTPVVDVTYAGAVAVTISAGALSEANSISFNFKAGTYSLTLSFGNTYRSLDFTGYAGALAVTNYTVFGNFILGSGMSFVGGASNITFASTNASARTITSNGVSIGQPLIFNGVGGSWQLSDALTVASSRTITLTNGVLNANNQNVSVGSFALGSGTKTLTLGSGTWTVLGSGTAWDANTNVTNLTVSASTGIISMTSASAKTFAGGAKTWPTLNQGGAGALTIQQSNTFANITDTVQPATVTLTSGTTQTVSAFSLAGTAGNLITLNSSSTGVQATLSDSSGIVNVSFVSIQDINATGGAVWNAYSSSGNIDAGNNTGWDFNDLLFRYIYTRRKNKVIFPI